MGDHLSGFIKASEVRTRCMNHIHPDVVRVLEDLAEQQRVNRSQILEVALAVDRLADMFSQIVGVVGEATKIVDKVRKKDSTVSSEEIGDINDAKRG